MRLASAALLALLLAVAGCAGTPGSPDTTPGSPTTGAPTTGTTAATPTTTTTTTPAGPANLSVDRATELALEREKAYLSERLRNLSHVEEWGVGGGVAVKEARVVNRTADGYVVEVQYPYHYSYHSTDGTTTRTVHADGISEATYVVRVAADGSVEVQRRSGTEVV